MNLGWDAFQSGDRSMVAEWFKSFGFWGPLIIILTMTIQMFLIIFPTWLPMIVAVLAYGAFWGVLISIAAVFLASTLGYFIGKHLSDPISNKLISKNTYLKISSLVKTHGVASVILFRISPFLSNDAISFIAGLMDMGYKRYILATMAGIIPLACAIAYFSRDIESLKSGLYWIGGAGIVLYIFYIWLKRRN